MVEKIPREKLIWAIQDLADQLESVPTARDMNGEGRYSISSYYREFDGWNDALQEAGFDPNHHYDLTEDDLLSELRRLAEELGYSPTREDLKKFGKYSANPYYREFESWNDALEKAGLDTHSHHDTTEQELVAEIQRLASDNKPPTRIDMQEKGKYSAQAYYSEFGSWSNAIEKAGYELRYLRPGNRREYDYGQGWNREKRQTIRERDDFECQHCGMTSETHNERYDESLHVHHLVPANHFESASARNDPRNLITLCRLHHRTWEAADDYMPLDQSLPEECTPSEVDPYVN